VRDALGRWRAPDEEQERLRREFLAGSTTDRRAAPRGPAVPPDRERRRARRPARTSVLLVLHRRTGLWLQPGGHVEDGTRPSQRAALREAVEETGIADLALLDDRPVHLERHAAPCGAEHHLDVRFALQAPGPAVPSASAESLDAAWFPLEQLPAQPGVELRALVAAAVCAVETAAGC
jgi:8-oxo-dGTP pyrophosphatase MutT (NUDIX family)